MKNKLIVIPLLALGFTSCDKVKDLTDQASSAVKDEIEKQIGGKEGMVDPELEKLVDRNEEGVLFRKDLPFPTRLEVRTVRRDEIAGRFIRSSAIGSESTVVNGMEIQITLLERVDGHVRYTLEQSSFVKPSEMDPDGANSKVEMLDKMAAASKPLVFRKGQDGSWSGEGSGFRAVTLSKQLSPVFDVLLTDNGLSARPLWFAKQRLKVGSEVAVSQDSLPMLLSGNAKGSCKLTLESFEAVEGHPCGVFAITGDFSRSKYPDFEGSLSDEDVTIQSGKVWLSLVYPVILKEELDTIRTVRSGKRGGFMVRGQGSVKVSVTRTWKTVAP